MSMREREPLGNDEFTKGFVIAAFLFGMVALTVAVLGLFVEFYVR